MDGIQNFPQQAWLIEPGKYNMKIFDGKGKYAFSVVVLLILRIFVYESTF